MDPVGIGVVGYEKEKDWAWEGPGGVQLGEAFCLNGWQ